MIKRYLLDIVCAVIVAMVAFLTTQRPVVDLNLRPSMPADKAQPPDAKKEETENVQKLIVREVVVSDALRDRNIFSPDGKYAMSKPGATGTTGTTGSLPENPYTLIGVLQGEEKKAVFRDPTGSIVTLTLGKKLMDGSIITLINNISVKVKKGEEEKELRIFSVKKPKPVTRQNP